MKSMSSKTIRGYEVTEVIGEGGFGVVYRAFQPAVKREVAIKVILPEYANDPDFIRGFETEAELIARLEHFHIIPLYDYWREPNGAYLVTRFLRGGSLRDRLEDKGRLTPEESVRLVQQICSALSVSHRHGVIHRDIKPANILLDDEGNMYLSDFGISISMESSDSEDLAELIGTPAYLSPEQVMSERVTPQSDIYSFGIVLFEALTGERHFPDDISPMRLLQMTVTEALPPISDYRTDLPSEVERIVSRATAKDPAKRYSDAMRLALDFRKAMAEIVMSSLELDVGSLKETADLSQAVNRRRLYDDDDTITAPTLMDSEDLKVYDARFAPNPYKGLRAFQEADANDFFGRKALVDQLIYQLEALQGDSPASRFLAVVGPSGSGKSSVVKAGLVPALREGRLPNSESWFVIDMVPSNQPFEKLETALLKIALDDMPGLLDQLQNDEGGLLTAVEQILPEDGELLLVIDQFEEFFTLVENAATRQHFVDNIMTAIRDPRGRVRVIVTIRADFYDRPLLYEDLGRLLQQRTEVVLPLSEDELEAAIVEPAKRVRVDFEAGLVTAIVKDVGEQPGTLPLLQFALTDLFERRVGQTMTLKAYEDSGGVLGVLARRADDLYRELDDTEKVIVRQVMLRLVTLGTGTEDTRRRVRRSEITIASADEEQVSAVIDLFGRYRLLTFDRDPATREPTIEVAHEALIRTWTRLREWVRESREDMQIHRRLTIAAHDWSEGERDASYLSLGVRLAEFEQFARTTDLALSVDEQDYLAASRQHEDDLIAAEAELQQRVKRLRRVQYAAGLTAILAIAALVFILIQASDAQDRQAQAEARQAEAEQREAAASTRQFEAEGRESFLSTSEAVSNQRLDEANANATSLAATQVVAETQIARRTGEIDNLRLLGFAQQFAAEGVRSDTTALLAIRALSINYSPNADRILSQALDNLRIIETFCPIVETGDRLRFTTVELTPDGRYSMVVKAQAGLSICDISVGEYAAIPKAEGNLTAAEMSSDGRYVAIGYDTGLVQVYEIGDATLWRELDGHEGRISSLAFSPETNLIATMGFNGLINVWNLETGEQLRQIEGVSPSAYHQLAFVVDGTQLADVSEHAISIWEVETSDLVQTLALSGIQYADYSIFSPTGDMVIIGGLSDLNEISVAPYEVWDIVAGELKFMIGDDVSSIVAAAFSDDGQYIVVGTDDQFLELWDTQSTEMVLEYEASIFEELALSPDNRLVAGVEETDLVIIDLESGEEIYELAADGNWFGEMDLQFSRDGQSVQFVAPRGVVRQIPLSQQNGFHRIGDDDVIRNATFAPDAKSVLTYSGNEDVAELWDVESSNLLQTFEVGTWVATASFSPNGQRIVFANDDGEVVIGDVETGSTEALTVEHDLDGVEFVYLSPDGRLGALQSEGIYALFRTDDGRVLDTLDTAEVSSGDASFSSDGEQFGFQQDSEVVIWNAETGATVYPFATSIEDILLYSISDDMQYVFVAANNTGPNINIQGWLIDIETGEIVQSFDRQVGEFIAGSSRYISLENFVNEGSFMLWDIEQQAAVQLPEGRRNNSTAPLISPDGQQLLLGAGEDQLWLSEIDTGDLLRELHLEDIVAYEFSSDGRWVVGTNEDGIVRLWHTDHRELINEACEIMTRDFTMQERNEFDIRDERATCHADGEE